MIADALQRLRELTRHAFGWHDLGPWIRATDLDAVLATLQGDAPEPPQYWQKAVALVADELRTMGVERFEDKRDKLVAILANASAAVEA